MTSSSDHDAALPDPTASNSSSGRAPVPRPPTVQAAGTQVMGSADPEGGATENQSIIQDLERRLADQRRELVELRAAEGTARALSRALPDYVQILDGDGRVLYQTPAVEKALGFRDSDIIGNDWLEAVAPEFRAPLRDIQQAMLERSREGPTADPDEIDQDVELLAHDGRRRHFALKLSNQYANPSVRGLIVSGHDMSARIAAARAAEAERDALRAEARARSELLGVLGHEVRTPLNGILGTVRLLRDTELDASQHDHIRTILRSGESLLALLNGLVDLARSDSGTLRIAETPFSPESVLTEVLGLARPQAVHAGLDLRVTLEPGLPSLLMGDEVRFRQVVSNLVHNALKFTRQGSVTVSARCTDGETLTVEVKDTGIGMSAAEADAVFKPFAQANDGIGNRFGGSGLGLAICQAIAEAWGGEIGVDSTAGRGSRFWFSIPARQAEEQNTNAADPDSPSDSDAEAKLPELPPLRVLLADDNPVNQRIARSMLENLGLRVSTATNGYTALEAVRRGGVDLVMMDVHMPDLDGVAATRAIRELDDHERSATPVIALTADTDQDDLDRYRAAGAQDTVAKPIDPDALARTIARVMRDRLAGQETSSGEHADLAIRSEGETSGPSSASGDRPRLDKNSSDAGESGVVVPLATPARAQGEPSSIADDTASRDGDPGPQSMDAWADMVIDNETIDERALDRLAQSVGQDQVSKLIDDFRRHSHHTVVQLRKALERHDLQAANRAAHELKGMSGSFGLHRLYDCAVEVGRHCKEDNEPEATAASGRLVSAAEEAVGNLELYRARKGA